MLNILCFVGFRCYPSLVVLFLDVIFFKLVFNSLHCCPLQLIPAAKHFCICVLSSLVKRNLIRCCYKVFEFFLLLHLKQKSLIWSVEIHKNILTCEKELLYALASYIKTLVFLNFLNLPNLLIILHYDNLELILHFKSLSVGLTKLTQEC